MPATSCLPSPLKSPSAAAKTSINGPVGIDATVRKPTLVLAAGRVGGATALGRGPLAAELFSVRDGADARVRWRGLRRRSEIEGEMLVAAAAQAPAQIRNTTAQTVMGFIPETR